MCFSSPKTPAPQAPPPPAPLPKIEAAETNLENQSRRNAALGKKRLQIDVGGTTGTSGLGIPQ